MNNLDDEILNERINRRLDLTLDNAVKRGERHVKHKKLKKISAYCATFTIFTSLCLVNLAQPAKAEDMPVIGTVFQSINSSLGIHSDNKAYDKYAQSINSTAKDKGVEVKVKAAILDDHNNLILSYEIKNENGFTSKDKKYLEASGMGVLLDGIKRVSFQPNYNIAPDKAIEVLPALSKDGEMLDLEELSGTVNGRFIDNNTFIGIGQYDMSSFKEVPNSFKIKIDINSIKFLNVLSNNGQELCIAPADTKGNWSLEFAVKKSKVQEVKTVKVDAKSEYVTIKDITTTPFTTDVSVKIDFSKIKGMKGVDENNKEYTNYNTINKIENDSRFSEITFRFMDIKNDVKKLKVVFLGNNNEEEFSRLIDLQ